MTRLLRTAHPLLWIGLASVLALWLLPATAADALNQDADQTEAGVPAATPAQSGSDANGGRVLSLSRRLMSPFCPGRTLVSCPSQKASDWISDIRTWVDQGMSDEEIVAVLQERVPEHPLSSDPGGVWDWAIGLGALGVVTLVITIVMIRLRRRQQQAEQAASAQKNSEDDDDLDADARADLEDKLDEELAMID